MQQLQYKFAVSGYTQYNVRLAGEGLFTITVVAMINLYSQISTATEDWITVLLLPTVTFVAGAMAVLATLLHIGKTWVKQRLVGIWGTCQA